MKHFSLIFILIFFFSANGQVTSSSASGRSDKTLEVEQSEARFNQLTAEVGDHFKRGLFHLQDNRRSNAREEFDKTIEVFLFSNVNVQSNQKLRECYSQLTETIYRMEFPTGNQPPNIRSLSATCGWNVDNDLADKIAKIVQTSPITPADTNLVASANTAPQTTTVRGFTEQKFEVSPLDELAELELTPERRERFLPERRQILPAIGGVRTVIAQDGDTVAKLAQRYGALPVEVAKYNGLFVTSTLRAGREVKIIELDTKNVSNNSKPLDSKSVSNTNRQEFPEQCKLGLANSPNIREIKLGMSPIQVEKILETKITLKDYKVNLTDEVVIGAKQYYFSGITSNTKPIQLENIDALFLYFYNNFLFRVFAIYTKPKVSWKDTKEFAFYLSDKFDLPKKSWNFTSGTSFSDHLYLSGSIFCDGFYLSSRIDEYKRPMIHLTDNKISDLVAVKEKQLAEKYKLKKMIEKQLIEKNESKKRSSVIEKEKGFKP